MRRLRIRVGIECSGTPAWLATLEISNAEMKPSASRSNIGRARSRDSYSWDVWIIWKNRRSPYWNSFNQCQESPDFFVWTRSYVWISHRKPAICLSDRFCLTFTWWSSTSRSSSYRYMSARIRAKTIAATAFGRCVQFLLLLESRGAWPWLHSTGLG